jgi:RNA polymerase sigma-70 factor (ECF subfamily)
MSLTGHTDRADDLVQDTLMRAVANIHRFEAGTNLNAWLFTILQNLFHSEYRKRRREVEDANGSYAARLSAPPEQGPHLDFEDFRKALAHIPLNQREALLLVGAEGLSYEEAAQVCGVAVGTIKSRDNRPDPRLAQMLAVEHGEEFNPDPTSRRPSRGRLGAEKVHIRWGLPATCTNVPDPYSSCLSAAPINS